MDINLTGSMSMPANPDANALQPASSHAKQLSAGQMVMLANMGAAIANPQSVGLSSPWGRPMHSYVPPERRPGVKGLSEDDAVTLMHAIRYTADALSAGKASPEDQDLFAGLRMSLAMLGHDWKQIAGLDVNPGPAVAGLAIRIVQAEASRRAHEDALVRAMET